MKSLKHLNKYFYKYRYRLFLGMLFVVLSNLFMPVQGRLVSLAVDMLIDNIQLYQGFAATALQQTLTHEVLQVVLICAGLIVLAALVRGFFMFLMRQSIIVMSRLIEFDLKNELFMHYQQLSQGFYRKNATGDLMARISEDVSRVRMYIGPAVMYYTNLVATFLVVIPTMFSIHAALAVWVLLPLPVLSYTIFQVNNIINKRSDAIQAQLSKITALAQETFSGIRVIKAFGAEKYFKQHFTEEANVYQEKSMHLAKLDATFFPLMLFLTGLSTIITVFAGGWLVLKGELTIGNIAEFVIYVNMLTWPVTSLGWTSSLVQRASASQQRINEFLQTQPEVVNTSSADFSFHQSIEFREVSFTYPGKNEPALSGINITLEKGKTLAILGSTGSGKTTLVQLLLRVMDVSEGQILVDGVPLQQINLVHYKKCIGYAPQDIFLFSDTIAGNIAFGLEATPDTYQKRVEEAARNAALIDTVNSFKDGFETLVGERGVTLSGGQKQRVSIARALAKNPEILVLDDCLSAVDTKTETEILHHLQNTTKTKTRVVVSHRVSSVKEADYIVVLHAGKLVEQGTHQQLLDLKGRYFELFESQKTLVY